tara:strand:+ start:80 stop:277 length:198 start_codon:yes stop_codon:yes gene_type:complete
MVQKFTIGDIVIMKKPHPCGTTMWVVDRIGADIGLGCSGCGRRLVMPRSQVEKRAREIRSHPIGD